MPHRGLLLAAPAGPVQAHSPSASIALPTPPDLGSYFLIFIKFWTFFWWYVIHPPTPFLLPPSSSSFSLPLPSTTTPFSIYSLFWFLLTWKIWVGFFFFPTLTWMGTFVFSANNVGSVIVRAFLQSFVLLCGFVFCCLFYFDFFPFMWSLGKHEFRIISHFYLNVVLRVNFLYWSLYWWVHATGNKFFVQKLQSESLCITETLFITSLLSPTQKTVGLNKIICILIYLKCL